MNNTEKMTIEITSSTPSDRSDTKEMFIQMFVEENAQSAEDSVFLKRVGLIYEDLKDDAGYTGQYIARVDNERAGFIWILKGINLLTGRDIGSITAIYVKPQFRQRGIAKRMMEFADDYCKRKKWEKITLNVINNNINAQKLYKSAGYTTEVLTMEKKLD